MNRWRFPTLSLHGIEGAYADQGGKTVIPRQVIGKFSLRIVPSQTPEQIEKCVTDYIMKLHAESGSANEIKVEMPNGGKPWVADINDPNFQAGRLGPFSNLHRRVRRANPNNPNIVDSGDILRRAPEM